MERAETRVYLVTALISFTIPTLDMVTKKDWDY